MIREFALSQVGPGWRLYSTKRMLAGTDETMPEPVGGICVGIIPGGGVDLDTGEVIPDRYRVLNTRRPGHPWNTLTADEIDVDQLAGVDRAGCETAALWCWRAAVHRPRGSKTDRLRDPAALHDAWILAAAWAGL